MIENVYISGYDTKCLLERISRCEFFKGRTMWVNMEIFNRINASIFSNAFETYSYEYYDNQEVVSFYLLNNMDQNRKFDELF